MKKILGILLMVALFGGLGSYAEQVAADNHEMGPLLQASVYEDNIIHLYLDQECELFKSTKYNLYAVESPDQKRIMEVTPQVEQNTFTLKTSNLSVGKLYVFEIKYAKIDGVYYSSYKTRFIPEMPKNEYGFRPVSGKITSDKTFEFEMSHPTKPTQAMLKNMRLTQNGERVFNSLVSTLEIVTLEKEASYRILCEVKSDTSFEYNLPYKLSFGDDFISEYNTETDSGFSEMTLYRLKDWECNTIEADLKILGPNVIQFNFNQDMQGQPIVYGSSEEGQGIQTTGYRWDLDEEEHLTLLTITFDENIKPGDTVTINEVESVLGKNAYHDTILLEESMQVEPLEIEQIDIEDVVSFQIQFNQPVHEASLALLDLKIHSVGEILEKELIVHDYYISPDDPRVVTGLLAPKNAFRSNASYAFEADSVIYNAYFVKNILEDSLTLDTDKLKQVKYVIEEAFFLDEEHILCRLSYPSYKPNGLNTNLKVIFEPDGDDDQLKISSLDVLNPYIWIIELEDASKMYDVYVIGEHLYDLTGRYELKSRTRIDAPWE